MKFTSLIVGVLSVVCQLAVAFPLPFGKVPVANLPDPNVPVVPGITEWKNFSEGRRPSAILDPRSCILQSHNSPSERTSLKDFPKDRFDKTSLGPELLLKACRTMKDRVGVHQCSRIFIGGHSGEDALAVNDLFYLWPYRKAHKRKAEFDKAVKDGVMGSKSQARDALAESKYCVFGPLGFPTTDVSGEPYFEWDYSWRTPDKEEMQVFFDLLDCFEDLIDRKDPNASIIFSSCGPKNGRYFPLWVKNNIVPDTGDGTGQALCAQQLADATGIRVVYSRGAISSSKDAGGYDTSTFSDGHLSVTPLATSSTQK